MESVLGPTGHPQGGRLSTLYGDPVVATGKHWPSLVSTLHGAFRNSPHGDATALWSDTLYQSVQTMLGGPSQILDLPGDIP